MHSVVLPRGRKGTNLGVIRRFGVSPKALDILVNNSETLIYPDESGPRSRGSSDPCLRARNLRAQRCARSHGQVSHAGMRAAPRAGSQLENTQPAEEE